MGTFETEAILKLVAVFIGLFLTISFILLNILSFLKKMFGKGNLSFIPHSLDEARNSILIFSLSTSALISINLFFPEHLSSIVGKLVGVALIVSSADIFVRLVFGAFDKIYKISKKSGTALTGIISMARRISGVIIYSVGMLMAISYISFEIGSLISILSVLILVFAFSINFDYLKEVFSGLSFGRNWIREGDFISIESEGISGFVDRFQDRNTLLRDLEGRTISVPNTALVSKIVKNYSFSEGNLFSFLVSLSNPSKKDIEALISACSRVASSSSECAKGLMPKVYLVGFDSGDHMFRIQVVLRQNSFVGNFSNSLFEELKGHFGKKLKFFSLEQ